MNRAPRRRGFTQTRHRTFAGGPAEQWAGADRRDGADERASGRRTANAIRLCRDRGDATDGRRRRGGLTRQRAPTTSRRVSTGLESPTPRRRPPERDQRNNWINVYRFY
ncbi:hypothetical protein EVAR_83268_1 [Eumeta japonica]|uniref:Uncharacterized protein n=1 Tax=Eumeta variegata TaxID=151549 RepID=A0A4C1XB25_EUMVA|nr:hypothetical protein EVAR_83268_1 [Eumeta japonica]